jgi:purine-binding chemotaxis protein CheW
MPTVVVLRLGGERCALRAEEVREIVPMARLARPAGLPSLLEGFLNLRGAAIPVLRIDRLFGLPPLQPGLNTPLVVLRGSLLPLALLVERAEEVVAVPDAAFLPVPAEHSFQDCALAILRLEPGSEPIHLLSSERLLLEQEVRRVGELREAAQKRVQELELSS